MTKIFNFALKIKGVIGRVAHAKSSDPATPPKFGTCTGDGHKIYKVVIANKTEKGPGQWALNTITSLLEDKGFLNRII